MSYMLRARYLQLAMHTRHMPPATINVTDDQGGEHRLYPGHYADIWVTDGDRGDAAVDILRDRERGVPRYNEFLRQLRKKPVKW